MTTVTTAAGYAERGISVVPLHTPTNQGCSCPRGASCLSPGKHPRIDWKPYQQQRATLEEIRSWWERWPTANVGIVTGMISGLCVLDVDPRNGGLETLAELDARGATMPDDNPVVVTGSEGLHHYFGLDRPLAKAAPFDGIELQADRALVVAPPSLHWTGRRYQWARDLDARRVPVPAWVRWAVAQVTPEPPATGHPLADAHADDVLGALRLSGHYLGRHRRKGFHRVRCPWETLHSNEDREAVVIEPGASPAPGWAFRCLHAHCADRSIGDLLDAVHIPRRRAS